MAVIESYEVETFRRFHLDPAAVLRYRQRLECIPPFAARELRAKKREVENLRRRALNLKEQTHELYKQLIEANIWFITWDLISDLDPISSCPAQLQWDLEQGSWGKGYRWQSHDKFLETYTERPEKPDALRAWNLFLVAFRSMPKRLLKLPGYTYYRREDGTSQKKNPCYWAEYPDAAGDTIIIDETDIRLKSSADRKAAISQAHEING